jgi:pantetheine-phosphate adenylyltransferase
VRHVVCPGSFDPPTNGHLDIVERAAGLADRVTVAVGVDTTKKPVFGAEERVEILRQVIAERGLDSVETVAFSGLLVHFCQRIGADAIIKGVEVSFLSSTLVRQVASLGGDVSKLVPAVVAQRLAARVHPRDLG